VKKLGLLLLAAASAFFTGLTLFHLGMLAFVRGGSEARVPGLEGLPIASARQELERIGFVAVVDREEYSSELEEGKVLEQRPQAGEVLRRGRKVWLTVSLGFKKTSAPNVIGLSYRQAGIALAHEGLSVGGVFRQRHSSVPRGAVISQDPPAGSSRAEGSRVDLLVSLGPEPQAYVLPSFRGESVREVEEFLRRHSLELGEKTELLDRSAPPLTVLDQSPPPGARIEEGERVDLVVSSRH
jgi:serine/threonine-protein kinase